MQRAQNGKHSLQRRDATGHLNPKYAADLRRRSVASAGSAGRDYEPFVMRPRSVDALASALGKEFVAAATTGDEVILGHLNEHITEDEGGPFVITDARREFGRKRDGSNPPGSTREPFPRALSNDEPYEPEEADGLDATGDDEEL
ncbi:MAG: hypothetical protein ACRENE_03605 [Polyangiaceae bacterium]